MFYHFIYLAKGFRMRPKVRSTLNAIFHWKKKEKQKNKKKNKLYSSFWNIEIPPYHKIFLVLPSLFMN